MGGAHEPQCEASYNPLGVTVRAMVLLLPRQLLSPKEDGMLKLLQGMAKVSGGLEDVVHGLHWVAG